MDGALALLVVDDDLIDRMAIKRALRSTERAIEVTETESGAGALELLAAERYDCILLDYRLPDADALGLVRDMRGRGCQAPIVVLTGQGDERIAVALMKAGATDYLTKEELSPGRLLQSVLAAVRVHQAERQAEGALREGLERLRFQSEASQILSASLDQLTVLANLSRLLVPRLADWCAVRLVGGDGGFYQASAYPDGHPWSADLAALLAFDGQHAPGPELLVGGASLTFPELADGPVVLSPGEGGGDDDLSSLLCVPINGYGQLMGLFVLARGKGRPVFSFTDLALTQDLALRLAVALHNAHLYFQSHDALRMRDEFVSMAAHELRTPLTGLLGYVQLLEQRLHRAYSLDDREARMLRTILEQGMRLNEQVTRLLDLSNMKSGEFTLERRPLDLGAILAQLVDRQRAALDQHTIELGLPEERFEVLGDEGRLEQAFEQLLHNAVKYSPRGGQIVLRASLYNQWAHIVVADKGIGIPSDAMPHLFRRFYRAKNADELAISGIGLGLYLVNEIVTLHGGAIEVQSEVGHGSSFTVRLPLLRAA